MNNDPIHSEDTQRHDPWLQRARTLYQEAGERVAAASRRSLDATRRALRNTPAPARRRLLPVLVPDLKTPSKETQSLAFRVFRSLEEVARFLSEELAAPRH